ncbi:GATA type zinc finger transcription factor family protein isoform 1 [Hibiscus syriacus]|uniref:GATA type zinc finger transcription factor family protein isoform 1 n=1 Tax=Hibiscus syriacus TaxID=106335 RepID=A0A6A3B4R9_HIBSY|nr:GATA type zinc finger transcription factor family protein isoform 1 [Hibiscus syriacus]
MPPPQSPPSKSPPSAPNADPSLIKAFAFSNTSLLLSIPNPLLPAIAANRSLALAWLYKHVLPFYPRSKITLVSVGNAVLDSVAEEDFTPYLLPAPAGNLIVKPLLQFLEETNSSFLINLYPYNLYRLDSEIPRRVRFVPRLSFQFPGRFGHRSEIFQPVQHDGGRGLDVDGRDGVREYTGSCGGNRMAERRRRSRKVEANEAYAEMYLRGLVRHLKSGVGTPLKKDGVAEVYAYELMDHENAGGDKKRARKWGILSENMTRKYNLEKSDGAKNYGLMAIFLVFFTFFFAKIRSGN